MSASFQGDHNDFRGSTFNGPFVNEQHVHPLPSLPTWPLLIGDIPPVSDHHQQRTITVALQNALTSQKSVALRQTPPGIGTGSVVSGMGGVGKTQLASAYAHRVLANSRALADSSTVEGGSGLAGTGPVEATEADEEVVLGQGVTADLVMWVNASTRTTIIDAYAREAPRILQREFKKPEEAARAFLSWLATTDRHWLIILDDLVLLQPPHGDGTPATLDDVWPPHSEYGQVLITTRDSGNELTERTGTILDLGVYTQEEAEGFLISALTSAEIKHTKEERFQLAELLGHLPLALGLAVGYLTDRNKTNIDQVTLSAYIDLFKAESQTLERLFPRQATGYAHTIATTWALSIDHADQQVPRGLARPLASILALLRSKHIPRSVLLTSAVRAYLHQAGENHPSRADNDSPDILPPPTPDFGQEASQFPGAEQSTVLVSEQDVLDALTLLARLNLISAAEASPQSEAGVFLHMHQLVQRAIREHATTRPTQKNVQTTADALLEVWPEIERDTLLAEYLRSHTQKLRDRTVQGRSVQGWLWQPHGHALLFRSGNSLGECGRVDEGIAYWELIIRQAEYHLGSEHPDVLAARGNLARLHGESGDAKKATRELKSILDVQVRVLGSNHPETFNLRHSIAFWGARSGDVAKNEIQDLEALLLDRMNTLGWDHPDTLRSRHNLASRRGEYGDSQGAFEAYRELLVDRTRILGPEHPKTLTTRHSLGHWCGEAGNPEEAARILKELLVDRTRILGPEHPGTLKTRYSHGRWCGEAGNPEEAVKILKELLVDRTRILGPEHPDTLSSRHGLAFWVGKSGDTIGAKKAFEELIIDRSRILGVDHPQTLNSRHSLALFVGESGNPRRASEMLKELLSDRLRTLGSSNRRTLRTRHDLAIWMRRSGRVEEAMMIMREAEREKSINLGNDHPETLESGVKIFEWETIERGK